MTAIWFAIWWINGFPIIHSGANGWFIWLCITVALDFLGWVRRH